jgi:Na+/H+ antiporter NhaA
MSTDTAFALGLLALVARGLPDRVRIFLLTVVVVDDLLTLLVIATVNSGPVALRPLLLAPGFFGSMLLLRLVRVRFGLLYFLLGVAAWVALQSSGIEPVVLGLAVGLLTSAYAPKRGDLERATDLFRLFREQPTPELAESARVGLAQSLSPNERLQRAYHPWTSYVIVPLFALANAGIEISEEFLVRAATSPITLGIVSGYVLGKPIGIVGATWLVSINPGATAYPGRLGRARRHRRNRRHRIYRLAADSQPRLLRTGTAGSQARHPLGRPARLPARLDNLWAYRSTLAGQADPSAARHGRDVDRPRRAG